MIRSLIWKEWMEQRWWLLLGCFIMVGFTAIGLQARVIEDSMIMLMAGFTGAVVLPIVIAMGLVAPEREAGTVSTLLRLPARPTVVYAVKTAMGALVVSLPLVAAMAVAWLMAGGREVPGQYVISGFLERVPMAVVVLVWTTTLGIRLSTEARVGVVGVAFLLVCMVLAVALLRVVMPMSDGRVLMFEATHWVHDFVPVHVIRSPSPGVINIGLYGWSPLQLVIAAAAWGVGAWLFGKPGRTRG
ncbi:hypothetical protein ACERK3_17220 [Phycisphaerales bacterium AB-hyl4]|uniref:ABC-2 type transport system permease protein n=1 Tax=Natronomicrosphaera hydrolytica TaxID=3242702 RepID=A0ABV4U903_9BACT